MNLWDRVKWAYRSLTWADFPTVWKILSGEGPVAAGVEVNERNALTVSAFWNGIGIIAAGVATLPRNVYRRTSDDGRERDRSQPAARLMARPNPNMTDVVFWETMVAHILTWGNAYAEIEFDRALRPIGLWPITPDLVTPFLEGGRLKYRVQGAKQPLDAEDVLHIPGLGFDGLRGYSVIYMARQSLGLTIATERFGAKFFGNGARPQTVLMHPGKLSPEAQQRLRASVQREQGGENQLGVMVAEEGMKIQTIGIPPDDAQFLGTRQHQIEEVARWLNIQPSKLKSKVGERPGGNLEADQIIHLTDTLRPILVKIEQELNRKLFPVNQQLTYYVEHNVEAMLRVDTTARMGAYEKLLGMEVITATQIAQKENLPKPEPKEAPIPQRIENVAKLIQAGFDPEESAQAMGLPPIKHLGAPPVTVQPVVDPAPPPSDSEPPDDLDPVDEGRKKVAAAVRAVLVDTVSRFVEREASQAREAAKGGPEVFGRWVERFYSREPARLRAQIRTLVDLHLVNAGLRADAAAVAEGLAVDYMRRSREELEALKASNLQQEVEGLVKRWLTLRPVEVADAIAAIKETKHVAA